MYIIVKHCESSGVYGVLTSATFKSDGHPDYPLPDSTLEFLFFPEVPSYVDEVPSALCFEYLEQAYSFLTFLGLFGEELLLYSVSPIDR